MPHKPNNGAALRGVERSAEHPSNSPLIGGLEGRGFGETSPLTLSPLTDLPALEVVRMNTKIEYSVRPKASALASDGRECTAQSVAEFAEQLSALRKGAPLDPQTGIDRKEGYLFCAPRLDTSRTWGLANTAPRAWIALDLDLEREDGSRLSLDLPLLYEWLSSRASLLWETHSSTQDAPRYRVVLFLDRQIDPQTEHPLACKGVMEFWREWGIVDLFEQRDQSFCTASQGMYSPPSGRSYMQVITAPLCCADQLIDRGSQAEQDALPVAVIDPLPMTAPLHRSAQGLTRQAESIFDSQLRRLSCALEGSRHDLCLSTARTIGGLVAGGYLDGGQALAQLIQTAEALGQDKDERRDFVRAVSDGFERGKAEPIDLENNPQWMRRPRPEHRAGESVEPPPEFPINEDLSPSEPSQRPAYSEPSQRPQKRPYTLLDGLRDLPEYLSKRGGRRLPTGLDSLDTALGGGFPCGLHVLGGRTGLGKTAVALEIAYSVVKQGGRVLYLSLEVDAREMSKRIARRVLALTSGCTLTDQQFNERVKANPQGYMDTIFGQDEHSVRFEIAQRLQILDLEYLGSNTLPAIMRAIREFLTDCEQNTPQVFPLVIVDYMQYIQLPSGRDKRIFMGEVAQALKAETLTANGCVVLGLSSIGREFYDRPPCSESLKEAGEIEFTAQSINILAYRFPNWDYVNMSQFFPEHKSDRIKHLALYCTKNRSDPPQDCFIDFDTAEGTVKSATAPDPYFAGSAPLEATPQRGKRTARTAPNFNTDT